MKPIAQPRVHPPPAPPLEADRPLITCPRGDVLAQESAADRSPMLTRLSGATVRRAARDRRTGASSAGRPATRTRRSRTRAGMPVSLAPVLAQVDEQISGGCSTRPARVYPSIVEGFGLIPFEAASVATWSVSHSDSPLLGAGRGSVRLVPSWSVDPWAALHRRSSSHQLTRAEVVTSVEHTCGPS